MRVEKAECRGQPPAYRRCSQAVEPERFVRSLPPPRTVSVKVLAYFRMGEDDPGAKAGQPASEKTINHGDPLPPEEIRLAHLYRRHRRAGQFAGHELQRRRG